MISSPQYGRADVERLKLRRELERRVLRYLRKRKKPILWDSLAVRFGQNGDIGAVLQHLREGHYITVDSELNVTISTVGLKRLEDAMF